MHCKSSLISRALREAADMVPGVGMASEAERLINSTATVLRHGREMSVRKAPRPYSFIRSYLRFTDG